MSRNRTLDIIFLCLLEFGVLFALVALILLGGLLFYLPTVPVWIMVLIAIFMTGVGALASILGIMIGKDIYALWKNNENT